MTKMKIPYFVFDVYRLKFILVLQQFNIYSITTLTDKIRQ